MTSPFRRRPHDDPALIEVVSDLPACTAGVTGQMQLLGADATTQAPAMLTPGPMHQGMRALAPEAAAVLPPPGRTGPVGMLTPADGADRGPFTSEDLVTARHVSARAGLVPDNSRLFRHQRGLAEGCQRSLLTAPPEPGHLQIVVRYVPAGEATEVGGDGYDAFLQPSGATVLVIGDVVGHDPSGRRGDRPGADDRADAGRS